MVQLQRHKTIVTGSLSYTQANCLRAEPQSNENAALYITAYLPWINGSTNLWCIYSIHPPPTFHPPLASPGLQLSIPRSASLMLLIYASQSKTARGKWLPSYCNKLWVNHSNHWVITVPHYIFQLKPSVSEDEKGEEWKADIRCTNNYFFF